MRNQDIFAVAMGCVLVVGGISLAVSSYGDRIYPDELVDDVRRFTIILKETIPQPAIDWLMSQPACMAQQ